MVCIYVSLLLGYVGQIIWKPHIHIPVQGTFTCPVPGGKHLTPGQELTNPGSALEIDIARRASIDNGKDMAIHLAWLGSIGIGSVGALTTVGTTGKPYAVQAYNF